MALETTILFVQFGCALVAAGVLGNWYLAEFRRLKAAGKPWYAAYLTPPGLIIIAVLLSLPLIRLFF